MKVFIVLYWDKWSGFPVADIAKVFSNKEAAQAYAKYHDFNYSDTWYTVEEYEVESGNQCPKYSDAKCNGFRWKTCMANLNKEE